ncbi:MAG: 5'-nucleotidase C-terminal domain-containing protein [Alkalilacustris sp.]
MSLFPYDYHADAPMGPQVAAPGLAGVAAMLARLRGRSGRGADDPPGKCLLFDCGDTFQGGPMADFLGLEGGLPEGAVHPMVAAMNLLGYDGATLGNHDFGYGLGFLERVLAAARFPVVLSNVEICRGQGRSGTPVRPPRALRSVRLAAGLPPLRLGLIGLAPPQLVAWEDAHLEQRLVATGMAEAAAVQARALRAEGAELVVALVHGGITPPGMPDATENAALSVAGVTGVDVLMLGHAHAVFPSAQFAGWPGVEAEAGRLLGRPAVMPGMLGSHVGVIDLRLQCGPDGWRHRCVGVRAIPVAGGRDGLRDVLRSVRTGLVGRAAPTMDVPAGAEDALSGGADAGRALARLVLGVHAATRRHVARPVGRSAVRLHSHFAQVSDGAALQLVAAAHRAWAAAAMRAEQGRAGPSAEAATGFAEAPPPSGPAKRPAPRGQGGTPGPARSDPTVGTGAVSVPHRVSGGSTGAAPAACTPRDASMQAAGPSIEPDDGAWVGPGGEPLLAAVAPLRAGGRAGPSAYTDVPAGPLLLRHVHDLYAFANGLRVLQLSAAMVLAWLERTAALFSTLAPDRPDTPLFAPQAPAYAFDVIGGLDYTLDLGRAPLFAPDGRRLPAAREGRGTGPAPAVGRVRGLTYRGRPLAPQTSCLLVTSSFRAQGGGHFPGTGTALDRAGGAVLLGLRGDARAALLAHVRSAGTIGEQPLRTRWRLMAPPGSTALFDTAPAAEAHLDEIATLRPEPLGLTPEGFLRLRLHF